MIVLCSHHAGFQFFTEVIPVHSGTALWERYSTCNATLIMVTPKARRSLYVFHSRRVQVMSFLSSAQFADVCAYYMWILILSPWGLVHASV